MQISVILPTKNRYADLEITLSHLCNNSYLPDQVLIIDQSNTSNKERLDTFLSSKACNASIIYFHKPEIMGLIEARNYGVSQSSGDLLLFLDDDITLASDFFKKLMLTYSHHKWIDAVCAVNSAESRTPLYKIFARNIFWLGPFWSVKSLVEKFHYLFSRPVRTKFFSGGYMSCKRNVFNDIGFDNRLKGHVFVDDIDFSYRASKHFNLVIDPSAKVVHRGGIKQLYNNEEAEYKRIFSRRYFFRKNVDKSILNYLFFFWLVVGTFLGSFVRSISLKSVNPLKGFIRGLRTNL